ncbi:phage tail protein [Leptolyngbya sp. FACHB-671]|uniref:phage tail protein n=1 Tax=Leptolyngbya sp. FACHB-671 TaxID=2692812 RepID=UPI00168543BF|nr:phage tail protein [Leptolyngbya sp. FACHB-671]MBD1867183.1 phage tail protein [Cyanobacteria bacterium FACHB-471]MBD2066463.1 phage tail protein [Leptolyngbya sp. FACHB-671]
MADDEILVSCRFYFEADGITDKQILEVSGLTSETPAAGGDKVLGSGKQAVNLRQAAPTRTKFSPVTVKVVATTNKDLYGWYDSCNKNSGGRSDWSANRKGASITVYDQAGDEKARWNLVNAYPTKYEGPKLEAGANDVANETITLVHEGIVREK